MRCRGIELVVAVGLVLGWALPGCAPVKDVVATKAPLASDAAAKDASIDAGGAGPGDAGITCLKCTQLGTKYITFTLIVNSACRVPDDKNYQQQLFNFLDDELGRPDPKAGETRVLDRCDGNPAGYLHDYYDASGGHFLCPWYCMGAMAWVANQSANLTACMVPCFTGAPPRQ